MIGKIPCFGYLLVNTEPLLLLCQVGDKPTHYKTSKMKEVTLSRVLSAIAAVTASPNHSVERAALWMRLHRLREKLQSNQPAL